MKKIIGILGSAIALISAAVPTQASPITTRGIATYHCVSFGFMMVMPEYYGTTRSGQDIWICIESQGQVALSMFSMRHPGPYPVMVCTPMQCKVVDETY